MTYNENETLGLLEDASRGQRDALDRLVPRVYKDLHQIAHRFLRRSTPDASLRTTALVHETYLRLVDQRRTSWQGEAHLLGVAATFMRRLLINQAERRRSLKRGGAYRRLPLDEGIPVHDEVLPEEELLAIDAALSKLAQLDARKARLVELRFFGGASEVQAARALGVSLSTAKRDWALARAWLLRAQQETRAAGDSVNSGTP